MSLAEGATFSSFEAFREAVKSYEEKTGVLFVTNDSLKNHDPYTNIRFPYERIMYLCKQGRIRPSKSKGLRVNLKSYKQGCTAMMRVYAVGFDYLKITKFDDTHNHPVNKEIASFYPENRKIMLDENDLILLKSQKISHIEVRSYLKQKYNKNIVPSSVYTLRRKLKFNPQISLNEAFVLVSHPNEKLFKIARYNPQSSCNDISSPKSTSSPENDLNKKARSNPPNSCNDISTSSPENDLNKKARSNPQNSCNDISTSSPENNLNKKARSNPPNSCNDISTSSPGNDLNKKARSNPQNSNNGISTSSPENNLNKKARSNPQNSCNDISTPKSHPEKNLNKKVKSNLRNSNNGISTPKSSPVDNLNKKVKSNLRNRSNGMSTPKSSSKVDYLSMKITSVGDKYICSHILMNDISSYLCPLPTEEFKTKMKVLQDLLHEWRQGQNNFIETEQDEIGAQDDDDDDESEVINKESEDESEVIHKESEVIHKESEVIHKESENESEVINQESEVINKESEVINKESEVINKESEEMSEESDESEVSHNVQSTCEFNDDLSYSVLRKVNIKRQPNLEKKRPKRKRKPPACFSSLKKSVKKRILFKAVVKEEYWSFENIDDNTHINSPRSMGSVVMDEQCNLEIIKDHFSHSTYTWIQTCVDYKLEQNLYVCPECDRVDDEELKMIGCDQCLDWYHYECVFMTPRKVPKNWYCINCKPDY